MSFWGSCHSNDHREEFKGWNLVGEGLCGPTEGESVQEHLLKLSSAVNSLADYGLALLRNETLPDLPDLA